jgi:hypothetical protein
MTLKQPTSADYTGTSYHNVDITTTPSNLIELCKKLDIEYHDNNRGEDKVNFDFDFYIPEKDLYFTVYDWKEYQPLHLYGSYEFHIGAKDTMSSLEAKEILTEFLIG